MKLLLRARSSVGFSRCARSLVAFLAVPVAGASGQVFDYAIQGSTGAQLGSAVSATGDIDLDGCDDFVVGAPYHMTLEGLALVVSGQTGSTISSWTGNSGSVLGAAVDGKIDSDGDGFNDVIVGAPADSTMAPSGGRVIIFSPHLGTLLLDLYSSQKNAVYGIAVRSLQSDIDGDGIKDFIVGAGGMAAAFVHSGATGTQLFQLTGQAGSFFGWAVSRLGDVNGDGVCDVAVGGYSYVNSSGKTTGRVSAFSGSDGSDLWHTDGADGSNFGSALGSPGDFDGDGVNDLVVGAPTHDNNNSGVPMTGCATVLSGANGTGIYKVFGDNTNDYFGGDVRAVGGDIDGDGVNDFIVGAPWANSVAGYARTFSGATGALLYNFQLHTPDPIKGPAYGSSVAGGDLDGDGKTDVIVGGKAFGSISSSGSTYDGIVETWTTAVAKWKNYGAGWPGALGIPALWAVPNPVIGESISINLGDSMQASTVGLLIIGVNQTNIPTSKGGTLLVDPLLFVPVSIPPGGLTLPGQIPNDPSLLGFDLYLQALESDPGASNGISFTQGLELDFGYA